MRLSELHESKNSEHAGYKLRQHTDVEADGDNQKIWHHITPPGGEEHTLDHTPYQSIDHATLKHYANFHKKHGRFPSRKDIKSVGPLDRASVERLASA